MATVKYLISEWFTLHYCHFLDYAFSTNSSNRLRIQTWRTAKWDNHQTVDWNRALKPRPSASWFKDSWTPRTSPSKIARIITFNDFHPWKPSHFQITISWHFGVVIRSVSAAPLTPSTTPALMKSHPLCPQFQSKAPSSIIYTSFGNCM